MTTTTWLTPDEVAAALRLPRRTVTYLCSRGDLVGARKLGRRWRIPLGAVVVPYDGPPQEAPTEAQKSRARGSRSRDVLSREDILQILSGKKPPPPTRGVPPAHAVTYFLRCVATGHIKIGYSAVPTERVASLQTASSTRLELLGIVSATTFPERHLHWRFRKLREKGEWFRPGRDLLAFIESNALPMGGGDPWRT